jgi:hypothetical protein
VLSLKAVEAIAQYAEGHVKPSQDGNAIPESPFLDFNIPNTEDLKRRINELLDRPLDDVRQLHISSWCDTRWKTTAPSGITKGTISPVPKASTVVNFRLRIQFKEPGNKNGDKMATPAFSGPPHSTPSRPFQHACRVW